MRAVWDSAMGSEGRLFQAFPLVARNVEGEACSADAACCRKPVITVPHHALRAEGGCDGRACLRAPCRHAENSLRTSATSCLRVNTSRASSSTLAVSALTLAGTSHVVSPSATSASGISPSTTSNSRYFA